jgi:hypothetical protein
LLRVWRHLHSARYLLLLAGAVALCSLALATVSLPPVVFAPRVDYNVGVTARALVAGDFNGDGNQDLAVANYDSSDVSVLLGNGAGGFTSIGPFAAAAGPSAIAAGLVNGDEILDLVVTADIDMKVSVLLGNGNGTFQEPRNVDVGLAPNGIVLADFNDDGRLDFANTNYFDEPGSVMVFLGNGDGTFRSAPGYCRSNRAVQCERDADCSGGADRCDKFVEVDGGPVGIAAGLLNDDEIIDLAVAGYDTGVVFILLGRGDGTFAEAQTHPVGLFPPALIIEDLNRDTHADIAVVDEETDSVYILFGDGTGSFSEPTGFVVGELPEAVVAADFNGDTFVDLATADSFGGSGFLGSVSVLLGDGTGGFSQPAMVFETDLCPFGLVAVDLDMDFQPDIATSNDLSNTVSILLNQSGQGVTPTPTPPRTCVGDCDLDETVAIEELVLGVGIVVGDASPDSCPSYDRDQSGRVEADELLAGIGNALTGCPL